jgi:hypothetical protein
MTEMIVNSASCSSPAAAHEFRIQEFSKHMELLDYLRNTAIDSFDPHKRPVFRGMHNENFDLVPSAWREQGISELVAIANLDFADNSGPTQFDTTVYVRSITAGNYRRSSISEAGEPPRNIVAACSAAMVRNIKQAGFLT